MSVREYIMRLMIICPIINLRFLAPSTSDVYGEGESKYT